MSKPVALIVGAGPGIRLAFAEALVGAGYAVGMASRNLEKLRPLAASVGAILDGGVTQDSDDSDAFTPRAIAQSYMAAIAQPRGAWSWEIELRSSVEPF